MYLERLSRSAVAALALALAFSGTVAATDRGQVCDAQALESARSLFAYRWYPAEQYCEGLYDKPRRTELDLVSLTRGKLRFDLASRDLEIRAPKGPLLDDRSIRVRGFGLAPTLRVDGQTLAYQMDSVLTTGSGRPWPLERVLQPQQLGASEIGLVAWLEGDAGPIYVPVEVRQGSAAVDSKTPILLTVRVPGYADWVKACLQPVHTIDLAGGAPPAVVPCQWRAFGAGVSAGATVDIPLPPGPEGLLSVAVKAKVGKMVFSLYEDVYRPAAW